MVAGSGSKTGQKGSKKIPKKTGAFARRFEEGREKMPAPQATAPKEKATAPKEKEPPASKTAKERGSEEEIPMNAVDLEQMLSFLKYHGNKKVNPGPSCQKILHDFHEAGPAAKRKILSSFSGPNGKSIKWASDFVTEEVKLDVDETGAVADFYTRPAYIAELLF